MALKGELKVLARLMHDAGLVRTDDYFRLKLHDKNPDAPLSPIYIDLRRAATARNRVWQKMNNLLTSLVFDGLCPREGIAPFDHVAPIPLAALSLFAPFAHDNRVTMLTVRPEAKDHGRMNRIDGDFEPGQRVLLMDDLITRADSKMEAAQALETAGLEVCDIVVVLDRMQGGREELERQGYRLHSLMNIHDLLTFLAKDGRIERAKYDEVMAYLAA